MNFLNDEYTLDIEVLADKKQIDKIRDLILRAHTPFSIGISGRWGSGKSSIMKYLMASLNGKPVKHQLNFQDKTIEEEKNFQEIFNKHCPAKYKKNAFDKRNIHTIWFNPWENENHQEPMVALLQVIHHHFSFFASMLKEGEKLASVTFQAGLDMLGSLKKLGGKIATNIKNIGEQHEFDNFQYIDRSQKFKFIFQESIEILLQRGMKTVGEDARIIIFIDDLDRCEDETIEKLLKEIKQYLSTKRCIFVFGYDRHHIEKSLANVGTKTSKETRAYLEKLFQATFYIKEPKAQQLIEFTTTTFESYAFVYPKDIIKFGQFVSSIIDPNPRRIKTFLMAIYFHIISYSDYEKGKWISLEKLKKLTLIAYMKHFYESAYSALENQPRLLDDLLNVFNNRKIFDLSNQREYFFHLEFKAHLHAIDIDEYNDKIEHNKTYEEKFLSEVYEMQGKHKSFEKYMIEFAKLFEYKENIETYL